METIDPNEAVRLIQTTAVKFAMADDDDPKARVDAVMADIDTVMNGLGDGTSTYLDRVRGQTGMMLTAAEMDEPNLLNKGDDPRLQRRVRFLRSMAQLLDARRAVGEQDQR